MSTGIPFETTLAIRDTCLCLHVQRAARALARRFDEALRPVGLTNGQFSLLMALNRPAPAAMGPVARLLARDGLVVIEADPADRRSRRISLTGKGRSVLAAALPLWRAAHDAVEAALPCDAEALRRALRALSQEGRPAP
jgi:DNA-binding MarR family transcriptional regulator